MTEYRRILFYVAMEEEAKFILPALALEEIRPSPGTLPSSRRYARPTQEGEIRLVLPGRDKRFNVNQIGPLAAALMVFTEAREFKPHLIINTGCAGGYRSRGARIGDVYLSVDNFYFHDRHLRSRGYDAFGEGAYPSLDSTDLAKRAGLKCGVVSSGSSFDLTPADRACVDKHDAVVKDMEAAAVAWAGWELHIPVLAVKTITDYVDEPLIPLLFVKNFILAHRKLSKALVNLLKLL